MSKAQRTNYFGRLSEKQLQFIQKVSAAGRKCPKKRILYTFLLVIVLLWFYLLSFCRNNSEVLSSVVCGVLLVFMLCARFMVKGETEAPRSDPQMPRQDQQLQQDPQMLQLHNQMLQQQQDQFRERRDEIYSASYPGEKEENFIRALMEENSDVVGWLTVPETNIDYPVMQTPEDEDYYLYRDFYGNENRNGCLLLAAGCDIENENVNWIIHGHNMESGAMFGSLLNYRKKSYMKKHSLIFLDTLEGRRTFEIIAAFESQVYYENDFVFKYYKCCNIESWEEFDSFYSNIKRLSLYDTGVNAVYGDRFITLSTCSYHTENGRFVVVGKELY